MNPSKGIWALLILVFGMVIICSCADVVEPGNKLPSPTPAITPSPIPLKPTSISLIYPTVTVWTQTPRVPILVFHRFVPDRKFATPATQVTLEGFQSELQLLYGSGYSLVSLPAWLRGDMSLPAGRRPLIISIEDAFFGDQISLDETGQPLPNTGLGILWQFSQLHPDFGFAAVLFANFGDKYY